MSNIKIIRPYKRQPLNSRGLDGFLHKEGLSRFPQTLGGVLPYQDVKGVVMTGLDENAISIRKIADPKVRELEEKRIIALKLELENKVNEDLGPTSAFWETKKDEPYYLKDGDNRFDLSDPYQCIDYHWITQLPIIARSLDEIKSGKIQDVSVIKYYIFETDAENENEFNRKKRINTAVVELDKLSEIDLRKVAFILNLKASDRASYKEIYSMVDEFVKTPKSYNTEDPIEAFNKATAYTPEVLAIKVLIKQLLEERIIKTKGQAVIEGETLVAKSIDDFEIKLAEDPELMIVYDAKTRAKKAYVDNI